MGHKKWSEIRHKVDDLPDAEERRAAARAELLAQQERFDRGQAELMAAMTLDLLGAGR